MANQTFRERSYDFGLFVIAVMVGVALVLVLLGVIYRGPGHDDLDQQLETVNLQLTQIICINLVPPEERTPERVSECFPGTP